MSVLSAAETARRVAARELSCEEAVRAALDRIAALEPSLDALLAVLPERALDRARSLDRALAAGGDAPPLAGVPLVLKDNLHLEGVPTTCGSRVLEGYVPPYTATAAERLEAAGAVVVAKSNLDEFAMGSSTERSAYKRTRNPWDLERVPGGSSGGSAAAVAARLAPLAIGSDTGGSIRQPAALCGVVGLKPTYGRVSRYGLVAFASSLDQVGPLAVTVEDAALALAALSGHDPRDATSARAAEFSPASAREDARGLRIGVPRGFVRDGVEPGTLARFEEALATLEEAGVLVRDLELPTLPHAIAAYYLVATAEASSNLARYDGVRYGPRAQGAFDLRSLYGLTRDAGFGPEVKRRIVLGTFALSSGYYDAYYLRAQRVRTLLRRELDRALEGCDAIATPTTPAPAFRLGEKTDDPLQMYLADVFTVPANLAGLPAVSLPCGFVSGLPVGLQLMGRPFEEGLLLRIGQAFQSATRHHEAVPVPQAPA
jgi:aspartyl-tRNA(Asn)/glutamyl-tRNA(Gln) amidotransferase subunit A